MEPVLGRAIGVLFLLRLRYSRVPRRRRSLVFGHCGLESTKVCLSREGHLASQQLLGNDDGAVQGLSQWFTLAWSGFELWTVTCQVSTSTRHETFLVSYVR